MIIDSGLGYIVGAYVAQAFGAWQWAFRVSSLSMSHCNILLLTSQYSTFLCQVTPVLGTVCCLLLAIVTQDPPRGMAEDGVDHHSSNTIKQDLKSLGKKYTKHFSLIFHHVLTSTLHVLTSTLHVLTSTLHVMKAGSERFFITDVPHCCLAVFLVKPSY